MQNTQVETQRPSLLIVDDEAHVRRAVKRILRDGAYEILEAASGSDAMDVLAARPVHVVMSDYRMPGMNGVELLRVVKERFPQVQRVMLTGQADQSAIEGAVNRSEIFRFITKPWDDHQLRAAISSAFEQYRLTIENERLHALLAAQNDELQRLNSALDERLAERTAQLQAAASEWRACFDAISDPVMIQHLSGKTMRGNTAFARVAGVAPTGIPKLECRKGRFGQLPCALCTPNWNPRVAGAEVEVETEGRIWKMRSFPRGEEAIVITYKDVTEERLLTKRLIHSEKMAAVGTLAGGVAHEINNPLGGILAFSQIMLREERSDADRKRLVLMESAALRAKGIVDSLLRFSRKPKDAARAPVDLARIAEEALFLARVHLDPTKYEVRLDLQSAPALGNANQLEQIVVNLVNNARQAMPGGGRITLLSGVSPNGKAAFLIVSDTGPGIPLEAAPHVFEPFFTTKPEGEGTGLGLAISYRIAEEHRGVLRFEPEAQVGTRFILELPRHAEGSES